MNTNNLDSNTLSPPIVDGKPLAILVVDDDPGIQTSLRRILVRDGFYVDCCDNIAAALERLQSATYFAILLDLNLPGSDRDDLLPSIRRSAPQVAVIIITGHADLQSTISAIRHGVDDYLVKPIEPYSLRMRLGRLAELHRIRHELAQSESRFRAMVDHLPAGAVYVEDDRIYFNQAIERITGYNQTEIQTIDDWFRVLCTHDSEHRRHEYETARQLGFKTSCVVPIESKHRGRRFVELAGFRYDHHEVWLVTDITEHRVAQHKLVQNERLAAIGEMVTGLAHESQNALQRASGCLDLLELDLTNQQEHLGLVTRIRRALEDLRRLYEEVRNYAAPIVLELESIDVARLCQNVFDDLRSHDAASSLRFEVESNVPATIQADSHRLRQVLRNLFENASQASKKGDLLKVSIEHDKLNNDPAVAIRVIDEGHGMDTVTAQRLFEPFYTTKQKGTGLGLAISRRIVDTHGGKIMIENTGKNGTVIRVTLPLKCLASPEILA